MKDVESPGLRCAWMLSRINSLAQVCQANEGSHSLFLFQFRLSSRRARTLGPAGFGPKIGLLSSVVWFYFLIPISSTLYTLPPLFLLLLLPFLGLLPPQMVHFLSVLNGMGHV